MVLQLVYAPFRFHQVLRPNRRQHLQLIVEKLRSLSPLMEIPILSAGKGPRHPRAILPVQFYKPWFDRLPAAARPANRVKGEPGFPQRVHGLLQCRFALLVGLKPRQRLLVETSLSRSKCVPVFSIREVIQRFPQR
jgi:hypothetical protein